MPYVDKLYIFYICIDIILIICDVSGGAHVGGRAPYLPENDKIASKLLKWPKVGQFFSQSF